MLLLLYAEYYKFYILCKKKKLSWSHRFLIILYSNVWHLYLIWFPSINSNFLSWIGKKDKLNKTFFYTIENQAYFVPPSILFFFFFSFCIKHCLFEPESNLLLLGLLLLMLTHLNLLNGSSQPILLKSTFPAGSSSSHLSFQLSLGRWQFQVSERDPPISTEKNWVWCCTPDIPMMAGSLK
jgi:hypothetical protein